MKLTASLAVTIVLSCLVASSFGENPFAPKSRNVSRTEDNMIKKILELASENKVRSTEEKPSLCADNSPVQTKYLSKLIEPGQEETCAWLEMFVPFMSEDVVPNFQLLGYIICGCPTKPPKFDGENVCNLCNDGSKIPEEYEYKKFESDSFLDFAYCYQASWSVQMFSAGGQLKKNECAYHQARAYLECGCSSLPEPIEDPCEICGEKYSVNEDVYLPSLDMSCGQATTLASFIPRDDKECVNGKLTTYELGCCSGQARCPDYDNNIFSVYRKTNPIRPCSWINTQSELKASNICKPDSWHSDALVNCPYTCNGKCTCEDRKRNKFTLTTGELSGQEKTCFWLSRILKKPRRKLCKRNPEAAKACPNTCEGWCYFK